MNRTYFPYLDLLRACAILAVIIIHTFYPFHLNQPLHTYWSFLIISALVRWAVPIYTMISGALLLTKPIASRKEFYLHRFTKIGIPLLLWMIIFSITNYLTQPNFSLSQHLTSAILFGQPLFFIFAILCLYAITPFLQQFIRAISRTDLLILAIASLLISSFASALENWLLASSNILPHFSFTYFLYFLGYFLAGYYLHTQLITTSPKLILTLFFGSSLFTLIITHILISQFGVGYKAQTFFELFSPSVMLTSLSLFALLKTTFNPSRFASVLPPIKLISTYSLGIYFFHLLIPILLSRTQPLSSSPLINSSFSFLFTFLFSFAVVHLIRKIRYSSYLGF